MNVLRQIKATTKLVAARALFYWAKSLKSNKLRQINVL
jgi:hypothetical protein